MNNQKKSTINPTMSFYFLNFGRILYAIKATAIMIIQNQNWLITPKANNIRFTIIITIKLAAIDFKFIF